MHWHLHADVFLLQRQCQQCPANNARENENSMPSNCPLLLSIVTAAHIFLSNGANPVNVKRPSSPRALTNCIYKVGRKTKAANLFYAVCFLQAAWPVSRFLRISDNRHDRMPPASCSLYFEQTAIPYVFLLIPLLKSRTSYSSISRSARTASQISPILQFR